MERNRLRKALLSLYLLGGVLPAHVSVQLLLFGLNPLKQPVNLLVFAWLWLAPCAAALGLLAAERARRRLLPDFYPTSAGWPRVACGS